MEMLLIMIGLVLFYVISNQNNKINRIERTLSEYIKNSENNSTVKIVSDSKSEVAVNPIDSNPSEVKLNQNIDQPILENEELSVFAGISYEDSSGEILGKIGIGALVLGVAFFLKYAFDNNWIGPTGRIFVGVLIGAILISIGQYFRKKYDVFSEVMFGGGIAILYLSFYAAHSFYNLIDPLNTGILMFLVTALTFILSFVNHDNKLAILAIIGGFTTPYIIGATGNNMFEVFAYVLILDVGVLAITIFKKWPELVTLALVGTAINFFTWMIGYYNESLLSSVIFFLILTFFIFLVASIYRIIIVKEKSNEFDYFLLLANAFGFFGIFYNLMKPQHESILGLCTLMIAIVYIILAYIANEKNNEDKTLNIFLPGLAVAFLSLAVPIQFSGMYIAIVWFIEACLLYLIALSMNNRGFQVMGVAVYILGLINFFGWNSYSTMNRDFSPIFNKAFGILIIAIASAYVISYIYYKYGSISAEIQKRGAISFIIIANILTLYAFSSQIIFYYNLENYILESNYSMKVQSLNSEREGTNYYTSTIQERSAMIAEKDSNSNKSNTSVSIFWAIYAAILTAVGFAKRSSSLRIFGLTLFIITAVKIFIDVWSLGTIYRIISFIGLGVIALVASFVYVKYKDRLKVI